MVPLFSQSIFNPNPTKTIIKEYISANDKNQIVKKSSFQLIWNQKFFLNSNIPNLENQNGLYLPKGNGSVSSFLLKYYTKNLFLSIEPTIYSINEFPLKLPAKENLFSMLNDVPLSNYYKNNRTNFRNFGLKINFYDFSIGYGNWDQWWGPGMHNSLTLSNNSEGFNHYFFGTNGFKSIFNEIDYSFKYIVSEGIKNSSKIDYFLSALFFRLKFSEIELGATYHILSGGNYDLSWNFFDASTVIMNQKLIRYWDQIHSYYIMYSPDTDNLRAFIEIGYPNRSFNGNDPKAYSDHASASIIGLRKYGFFGQKNIVFGAEYARIVHGVYYNLLPTPNWYDNKKYNYSSYNGRRWAAHSGSDSDDLLLFMGYINKTASFIYGINYERHGVTFRFPPEVKLESRIAISYKYNNTFFIVNFENEYFEHYGFVDSNNNVWDEEFEPGSIQRTNTILLSIEKILFNK
tara:strand:- start:19819 stop:21198 length:1380 start_codon:yes stop_codon:yes gene_type:complete